MSIPALLCAAVLLWGVGCNSTCACEKGTAKADAFHSSEFAIVSPTNMEVVALLSSGQKEYLGMERKARVKAFADEKERARIKALGYYPQKVRLSWNSCAKAKDSIYSVCLSLGGLCILVTNTPETSVEIDNLEIAKTYDWSVSCNGLTKKSRFQTETVAPRLLRIPGVPNVRDLGGRLGLNGRRVRQGMVYRTAGLNDNAKDVYYTKEELLSLLPDVKKAKYDAVFSEIKAVEGEATKSHRKLDVVLPSEWMLFCPSEDELKDEGLESSLADIKEVPTNLFASAGIPFKMKSGESASFSSVSKKGVALLICKVTAPHAGYIPFSCGGDYYWKVYSNGKEVLDLFETGNSRYPYSPLCYNLPLFLEKGDNIIAIAVKTGTASWRFGFARPEIELEALFSDLKQALIEKQNNIIGHVIKGRIPGKNRLTKDVSDYLTKTLGVKSDIDLRTDGECYGMTGSPMGDDVTWFHYSSSAYSGMQTKDGIESFSKVFRVFLDCKNYPIIFHCIAGQDRTGSVAFILNGLLGVSEEELYLDWEATGFWNGKTNFNHELRFNMLVSGFEKWPGETLNEKIESYVLGCGFTREEIEHFRQLMLE